MSLIFIVLPAVQGILRMMRHLGRCPKSNALTRFSLRSRCNKGTVVLEHNALFSSGSGKMQSSQGGIEREKAAGQAHFQVRVAWWGDGGVRGSLLEKKLLCQYRPVSSTNHSACVHLTFPRKSFKYSDPCPQSTFSSIS